jgi:cbb3-type cytochrome oxidase maturation protein
MDALIILAAILIALVGLDIAAFVWGVDSRDGFADDRAR